MADVGLVVVAVVVPTVDRCGLEGPRHRQLLHLVLGRSVSLSASDHQTVARDNTVVRSESPSERSGAWNERENAW